MRLDPTHYYRNNANPHRMIEAAGLLAVWLNQAELLAELDPDLDVQEYMDEQYNFGLHPTTGGRVCDDGTYLYPEDPPLRPILSAQVHDTTVYVYTHAIVAFKRANGETFVTRMD